MKYTNLPNTNIKVSKICLGTMTFGEQNTEKEGHQQLDFALDKGVNFIDTAEMYSVPGRKETQGSTEKIIGTWIAKGNRDKIVLATKISGPSPGMPYIRDNMGFSKAAINDAIEKSLKRLQTDYIDLYQLHWPERKTNCFGVRNYQHFEEEQWQENFNEVVTTLNHLIKQGKIRHYGLSNETPYGILRYLEEAKSKNLSQPITIQNPYSLLNRTFEIGNAEISIKKKIGLLAYSPLAFGILSGKFLNGKKHPNSRVELYPQMARYKSVEVDDTVQKYAKIAQKYNVSLTQMSLAFINQQPFLTSNIIGATNLKQLKENIESIAITLPNEVIKGIEMIFKSQPNPAP
ncbi:MAG: aldo/keto reductase [Flavobacteriaceae bacterium]|nr:aldo/keto reductase [Flavobacteriaceae bacterium]